MVERLRVNEAYCISIFLDIKSIYCFLRIQKRLFPLWIEEYFWTAILTRENRSNLTLSSSREFSIDECIEFKPYLWTKAAFVSAKSTLRAIFANFSRVISIPLDEFQYPLVDISTSDLLQPSKKELHRYRFQSPAFLFWLEFPLFVDPNNPPLSPQQCLIRIGMDENCWDYSECVTLDQFDCTQYVILLPQLVVGRYLDVELVEDEIRVQSSYRHTISQAVKCVGLPAVLRGNKAEIDTDTLPEGITLCNYQYWIERMTECPSLVTKCVMKSLYEIGKIREYFQRATFRINYRMKTCESSLLIEHFDEFKDVFSLKFMSNNYPADIGDILLAAGKVSDAYRIFSYKNDTKKMIKCLLVMKDYRKCLKMIDIGKIRMDEVKTLAKELRKETAMRLDEYIDRHSSKKQKKQ